MSDDQPIMLTTNEALAACQRQLRELRSQRTCRASLSLQIPWGSCADWAWAIRQSAANLGLGLSLHHSANWPALAEGYYVSVWGTHASVVAFRDWLDDATKASREAMVTDA